MWDNLERSRMEDNIEEKGYREHSILSQGASNHCSLVLLMERTCQGRIVSGSGCLGDFRKLGEVVRW